MSSAPDSLSKLQVTDNPQAMLAIAEHGKRWKDSQIILRSSHNPHTKTCPREKEGGKLKAVLLMNIIIVKINY